MDVRQLKAFIAVFEERSITRAAARLFITQPALSVTIRQLEEELATTLFIREARGMAVTEAARLLYPQAQRLLQQMSALAGQFRQQHHCLPLALGVDQGDIAGAQLAAVCRRLVGAVPALQLLLLDGCSGVLRLASEASRCEDELFLPLLDEPYVLAVPESDALSGDRIEVATLDMGEWLTCPAHPAHQRLLALLGTDTALLQSSHQAATLSQLGWLVAAGLGRALLPQSLAVLPGVRTLALQGSVPRHRIGLCYTAARRDELIVGQVIQALQSAG